MEQELIRILISESSDSDFQELLNFLRRMPGATKGVLEEISNFRESIKEFAPKQLDSWKKRKKKENYQTFLNGLLETLRSSLLITDITQGRYISADR